MELNWSTFILEIVNFLVLVWILKRFLFRPVQEIISRRRAEIEAKIADAQHQREEADVLRKEYENRQSDWRREQEQARAELAQDLLQERTRALEEIRGVVSEEEKRQRAALSKRANKAMREADFLALKNATCFASRLLASVAGPEVEERLVDMLVAEIKAMSSEEIGKIRAQWGTVSGPVEVISAYPLPDQNKRRLEQLFNELAEQALLFAYNQDSALVAGVRIAFGSMVLQANVADELALFVEHAHDRP